MRLLMSGVFLFMVAGARGQEPATSPRAGALLLDLGHREINKAHLGYGWSSPEKIEDRFISWTNRMEADIHIELEAPIDRRVDFLGVPLPHGKKDQRIGLYVNYAFVGEWVVPVEQQTLDWRGVAVPARFWKEGANVLTVRVAHLNKPGSRDKRRLGLKVDKVWIAPVNWPPPPDEVSSPESP